MKHRFAKVLALILALALGGFAAMAEAQPELSDDVTLLEVKIGGKIYSCVGTVEDLAAQGIRFTESEPKPGYWHNVDNGRQGFKVLVDALDRENAAAEDIFVCGYQLDAEKNGNVQIYGGLTVGEITRDALREAWGNVGSEGGDYDRYDFFRKNVSAYVWFESGSPDARLKRIEFTSDLPLCYGMEVSELAGVADENVPDPADFAFNQFVLDGKYFDGGDMTLADLEAKGWRVSARDLGATLPTSGAFFISGNVIYLYNGSTMIQAFIYNPAQEGDKIPLRDGSVLYIGVGRGDKTDLVIADGLKIGCSLDDVKATFGDNFSEEKHEDAGYTFYEYTNNDMRNGFSADDESGEVIYIRIYP